VRRRHVGYVFQRFNLVAGLTALENVMLPLELDGTSAREARERAREVLALVALEHHLDRYPDDFSGGEQQPHRDRPRHRRCPLVGCWPTNRPGARHTDRRECDRSYSPRCRHRWAQR